MTAERLAELEAFFLAVPNFPEGMELVNELIRVRQAANKWQQDSKICAPDPITGGFYQSVYEGRYSTLRKCSADILKS